MYFSDEMGENIYSIYSKITKVGGMFKDFPAQNHTLCLRIFLKKVTYLSGTSPYALHREYPPPPPGGSNLTTSYWFECD